MTIRRSLSALVLSATLAHIAAAADVHAAYPASAVSSVDHDFDVTASRFDEIRTNPARLRPFLQAFPKGADLHNHLVGAIYAEHMLDWAARDQLCVSAGGAITSAHCAAGGHDAKSDGLPAAAVIANPALYARSIDALSMRDFVPTPEDRSGHDHFFATFDRFMPATYAHEPDMLADALNQAAMDHVQYVELMISPQLMPVAGLGANAQVTDDGGLNSTLASVSPKFAALVSAARAETDKMEAGARQIMRCGSPDAAPGCGVSARYLYQTVRVLPPGMVFSQIAFGYALAEADPRFVGINIVAPEDNPVAMRDYALHMRMFHFLSARHPTVKLSLHAGELTGGLVPPEGLRDHIRQAVEVAGASRIGHGVDVLSERDPEGLLAELAQHGVMVEINLTSNDQILGVRGDAHPFMTYRAHDVPVALSTDDEGVSRGSLTNEYLRAALTYPLSYTNLRDLSRTGLEHAFAPGRSLWAQTTPFRIESACAGIAPGSDAAAGPCHDLLASSEKARLQWALEGDFIRFEHNVAAEKPL
ncbi:adenosine deaminase [Acetobacter sacchari]|uniref:adenosine deaminase n=1 Tax=Acetobacter sacchari TaxID=2661687 RepID=A0ABS3LY15_9PROT|nr:adenosine deaminase [Acetobacter sacchari]MBO1360807.1 adenosine deaminase [Acetobacter sacchari]